MEPRAFKLHGASCKPKTSPLFGISFSSNVAVGAQERKCSRSCHGHARAVQPIHTIVLLSEDTRSLVHLSHGVPCWS